MQLPQSLLIVIALEVLMPLSAFAAAVLFAVPILAVERQPRWLCPNPQGPNHILDLRVLCHLHFLAAGLRRGRSCSTRPAPRAALLGPRAAAHNKSARCTKHRCPEAQVCAPQAARRPRSHGARTPHPASAEPERLVLPETPALTCGVGAKHAPGPRVRPIGISTESKPSFSPFVNPRIGRRAAVGGTAKMLARSPLGDGDSVRRSSAEAQARL